MKEIILVMDNDPTYAKKFCNQANKLYSKKYNFLTFTSMKQMKKLLALALAMIMVLSLIIIGTMCGLLYRSCAPEPDYYD